EAHRGNRRPNVGRAERSQATDRRQEGGQPGGERLEPASDRDHARTRSARGHCADCGAEKLVFARDPFRARKPRGILCRNHGPSAWRRTQRGRPHERGFALMRNVVPLMQRELAATFLSPVAYIVAAVFLVTSGYFFLADTLVSGREAT